MTLKNSLFVSLALFGFLAGSARATPITGQANTEGTWTISLSTIDFHSVFGVPSGAAESGSFAGLVGGTIGEVLGQFGPPIETPFMVFNESSLPQVGYILLSVSSGSGTAADCLSNTVGNVCTPPVSPLTLDQLTADSLSVSYSVVGAAFTGTEASGTTLLSGTFTSQITGTIGQFLTTAAAGGETSTYLFAMGSPTSTTPTTVPEPSSLLMLATGVLGTVFARRGLGKQQLPSRRWFKRI